jgi:uncharacterized protein YacL
LEKFVRVMFYSILSIFGGLLGYQIGQRVQMLGPGDSPLKSPVNLWALVILGVLVGISVTPLVSGLFLKLVDSVIAGLKKVSLHEAILGSIGLIFGLLIATLINLALGFIPFERIEIVGEFIKPFLYLVIVIFWGYLGVFFATRMVFVQNVSQLFNKSGKTSGLATLAWQGCPKVIDTSVIVDGRIYEICKAGFLEGPLIVPRFVLNELQQIADSADILKRNRGRRGLDVLHNLRNSPGIQIDDTDYEEIGVDAKLVKLSQEMNSYLLTTDYNLNKVAQLQGLKVLNINELANALKPVVLPGETLRVEIIKEGKESGQGVGYLDDGTMIVVEDGRRYIGDTIDVEVSSVIQTMAGKMIFGRRQKNSRSQSGVSGKNKHS